MNINDLQRQIRALKKTTKVSPLGTWEPNANEVALALRESGLPADRWIRTWEKFRAHQITKARESADWMMTLIEWCKQEVEYMKRDGTYPAPTELQRKHVVY